VPDNHWKVAASRRRELRQDRPENEVPCHKAKKGKRRDKPFHVQMKLKDGETCWFFDAPDWRTFNRYAKVGDAEKGMSKAKRGYFADLYEFRILESYVR